MRFIVASSTLRFMANGRPRIQDVAAAANVSITTVSHALSGKGRLPEETRELVRRTAQRLGYSPSRNAQALATGRSMLLGIQASGFGPNTLVPDLSYFTDMMNSASSAAITHGYALVLLPPRTSADSVGQMSFDGAIIIDPLGHETLLQVLSLQGKPIVTTGRLLNSSAEFPYVDSDHFAATRLMMDHFWERGYRRPAILTAGRGLSYVETITATYREWCSEHNVPVCVLEVDGPITEEGGRQATTRALASGDIDGIYATLDVLAIGALQAARSASVSVPTELGIAAITDSPLLRVTSPAITALELYANEIGTRAIGLLIDTIEGKRAPSNQSVPAMLVPRLSTSGKHSG